MLSLCYGNDLSFSCPNKTHFHKKGCAIGLILKVRVFGTPKWPMRAGRLRGWSQGQLRLYVEKNHVVTKPRYSQRILSVPLALRHMKVTAYCSSYHETTNSLGYLKLKLVCSILCFSRRSATYLRSFSSKNLGCSWYGGGSGRGDAMCSTRFALSYTLALLQSQPKGSWEGRFAYHFPMCHCLFLAFP